MSDMVSHFQILSTFLITADYPIENTLSERFTGKVFRRYCWQKRCSRMLVCNRLRDEKRSSL